MIIIILFFTDVPIWNNNIGYIIIYLLKILEMKQPSTWKKFFSMSWLIIMLLYIYLAQSIRVHRPR